VAEQQQQLERQQRHCHRRWKPVLQTFGLFGLGRRQHLHAFVGFRTAGQKRKAA